MPNENKRDRLTLCWTLALCVLAVVLRQLPYYIQLPGDRAFWNLVPVGALALFAGSRLRTAYAYLIPVGVMLVSDLLLIAPLRAMGMSAFSWDRVLIYGSFALYVLLGRLVQPRSLAPLRIFGVAVLGSVQFFVISNFGAWLGACTSDTPYYAPTLAGLLDCYIQAIPFYKNTLAGDLLYSALFFGLHAALVWGTSPSTKADPAVQKARTA